MKAVKTLEEGLGTRFVEWKRLEERLIGNVQKWEDVSKILKEDDKINASLPDNYVIDPRNNLIIIYAPHRAKRLSEERIEAPISDSGGRCVICDNLDEIPILMQKELVDLVTPDGEKARSFINANLFQYIQPSGISHYGQPHLEVMKGGSFVMWLSNAHQDLHELSYGDNKAGLDLIADFEKILLHSKNGFKSQSGNVDHYGHFQIIKNKGKAVGGSVEHGHYQMVFLSFLPKRTVEDQYFAEKEGQSFARFIREKNPTKLKIKDYGDVLMVVPDCAMKRPLDAMIFPKDTSKNYLHDLNDSEREGVARALCDSTKALSVVMPRMGREFAYNLEFHTSTGFYIEILPYTQENGGLENMGIYICQSSPDLSVKLWKDTYKELGLL